MIIPDRVNFLATGAVAAQTNIGNFVCAEWSRRLLGITPACAVLVPTDNIGLDWTWQLTSNELKGFLPVDGPGVWGLSADATSMGVVAQQEYFPLNIPVFGGETVTFQITLESAVTGNATGFATVWYGEEGDIMPSSYDCYPDLQRYYLQGTFTAAAAGAARATGTAYNVVGGERLTEVYGNHAADAMATAVPDNPIFELSSSGFAASPIRYGGNPASAQLGAADGMAPPDLTRIHLDLPIDRYCVIQDYADGFTNMVNTADWQTGVQFVRPGE